MFRILVFHLYLAHQNIYQRKTIKNKVQADWLSDEKFLFN